MLSEHKAVLQIKELKEIANLKPYVIVGVPEVGLVGTIVTSYLIRQLAMQEIGYVDSESFPQIMVVHASEPKYPVRMFQHDDIISFHSEIPLAPRASSYLASEIVSYSVAKGARAVIGITGIPSKRRIESSEALQVFAISNTKDMLERAKDAGAEPLEEGMILGSYASLLKHCMAMGIPNLTLLAESFPEFPDPEAALSVIKVLSRMINIDIDTKPLLAESEELRLRLRELMHRTQQSMQEAVKLAPSAYA